MKKFFYYGKTFEAPDWAEWVAMDKDQKVWAYCNEPYKTHRNTQWCRPPRAPLGPPRRAQRIGTLQLDPDMWTQTLTLISDLEQVVPKVKIGKMAPHINNEVRLVLSGNKPLASIEKYKDIYGYALAIALANTGALTYEVVSENEVVITLPHNKHLIQEWKDLLCHGVKLWGLHGFHYRMGKLYGYTDEDIDLFIKSDVQCDCNKCKGNQD